jgi:hypothetical protein
MLVVWKKQPAALFFSFRLHLFVSVPGASRIQCRKLQAAISGQRGTPTSDGWLKKNRRQAVVSEQSPGQLYLFLPVLFQGVAQPEEPLQRILLSLSVPFLFSAVFLMHCLETL